MIYEIIDRNNGIIKVKVAENNLLYYYYEGEEFDVKQAILVKTDD